MKYYLVLSCNTEGGDAFVEGIFKTKNSASLFLKDIVIQMLDELVDNGYGDSRDDFEYFIDENAGDIYLDDCTYYFAVTEIDTDEAV